MPTTGSHPRSLVSLDYSQYHRYYHLSSWSSLAPRRARSGGQPRRTWGQAHELCSDRALRRPAVARCAAPPGAAPMPFPAFRCLHPKRAVALLGHTAQRRIHRRGRASVALALSFLTFECWPIGQNLGISKSRSSGFPRERRTTDLNSTGPACSISAVGRSLGNLQPRDARPPFRP